MLPISLFACTGSGAWAPFNAAAREAAVERDERCGRMFGLVHGA
ncbi:hypothetical protein PK69_04095 [Xanthomonas phaseoli pv. phaseoli]|uniref:Secreted protein n=1 Tax=Xanthomonas campestris pv. phaseoli TaxID=317013 RepID=A0AB34QFV8_XANCH|nr:hypothetical protein AC609_21120 [Xanthomonas phaseoli pv. phaseoli]AZU32563.1 hypothetical protein AC801_23255 [Xanthomonas sp. ISO98C4]AZU27893.1 hypothetical protein AC611_21145 [Xanthomonas phaseoli pv. phaseoli]AZU36657.1 hypothetical protein AC610_21110 [Xanthomonas phaseoli pv. phaseoli]KGT50515.1 hypothetical protein NZ02_13950 [Xanthomonas phaseoli pv. phaseoli]